MSASFIISLDFELNWGVRDKLSIAKYGPAILGVRQAIPKMLDLFKENKIEATWATVGFLLFENKKDLINNFPDNKPAYANQAFNNYSVLDQIGDSEASDPYHFGLSLAQQILETDGMELASHTFSHYYCLEKGQTADSFEADLQASIHAGERLGSRPLSLVFPRNQFNDKYLGICKDLGFQSYRGNETSFIYKGNASSNHSVLMRAMRLADSYINLTGTNSYSLGLKDGISDIKSSRFLRPYSKSKKVLEKLKILRIKSAMTESAKKQEVYHLWWHPHNFGTHLKENMVNLSEIIRHFCQLRDRYGMVSKSMINALEACE